MLTGANVIIWDEMLTSGMQCYHLELMYYLGQNFTICDEMLSYGAKVIICGEMLSSGIKCYHLG